MVLFVFFLLLSYPVLFLYGEEVTSQEGVVRYERKYLTYYPLRDRVGVSQEVLGRIEGVVRKGVEQGRFDTNPIPSSLKTLSIDEVAKLTKEYIDRVKLEKARKEAEWDITYKDFRVTAEDLRRIANSAYLYAPELLQFVEKKETIYVKEGKAIVPVDHYKFFVEVFVRFYRVEFSTGTPVLVAEVVGKGEGEDTTSLFNPPPQAREKAFREALDLLHLDLRTKVRSVSEFRLKANVDRATWNGAYFSLTKKDGLPLGTLLKVEEVWEGGKVEELGYLIVREVGDGEVEKQSYAQIVAVKGWKLTGGEIITEVPQKGIRVGIAPFFQMISAVADSEELQGERGYGIKVLFSRAFEEETQIPGFSGEGRVNFLFLKNYFELSGEVGAGILRSFRRLFFGGGVRVGYLRSFTEYRGSSARVDSFGFTPYGLLLLWISPSFSFEVEGGYRFYLPSSTLVVEDETLEVPKGFRYNPSGLYGSGGVSFRF
jgi:hypothetical protein